MNSERIRNKKFYLATVVIILAIVSIAASVMFINNNNSSSVLEAKDENPSSNSYDDGSGGGGSGGSGGGSGDYSEDGPSDPFRIFFTRGIEIYSTKADGTDLQNHYKGSKSGLGLCNLITSNSGSKLLFYDEESKSVKVLKLATDEIEDLGIKSQFFSISSDDKKLVCLSSRRNPNDSFKEFFIFDIETKNVEFKKDFRKENLADSVDSVPQFVSNNSEILFKSSLDYNTSKIVKFNINTRNIQDLFDDKDHAYKFYSVFKLSPDGNLLAFVNVTKGLNYLKIYDFESGKVEECFKESVIVSSLQWSPNSKSIYLSVSHSINEPYFLHEYRLIEKDLKPLKDKTGKKIISNSFTPY